MACYQTGTLRGKESFEQKCEIIPSFQSRLHLFKSWHKDVKKLRHLIILLQSSEAQENLYRLSRIKWYIVSSSLSAQVMCQETKNNCVFWFEQFVILGKKLNFQVQRQTLVNITQALPCLEYCFKMKESWKIKQKLGIFLNFSHVQI